MLYGIDVSAWQGRVNWSLVRRSGYRFAMAKASEGTYLKDPTLIHNWPAMKNHGLVRGAYCFLHPSENAEAQCDNLHAWVRDCGRFEAGDFVMIDLEVTDGMGANEIVSCAEAFARHARRTIAKPVFLYTGDWFWQGVLGDPESLFLSDCPLILAAYPNDGRPNPENAPAVPRNWPVLSFWQYSCTGRVPGVSGACDQNVFFGDIHQLKEICRPL